MPGDWCDLERTRAVGGDALGCFIERVTTSVETRFLVGADFDLRRHRDEGIAAGFRGAATGGTGFRPRSGRRFSRRGPLLRPDYLTTFRVKLVGGNCLGLEWGVPAPGVRLAAGRDHPPRPPLGKGKDDNAVGGLHPPGPPLARGGKMCAIGWRTGFTPRGSMMSPLTRLEDFRVPDRSPV